MSTVSVVIPIRDGGDDVAECLQSIEAVAPDVEIVVVDDASEDGSAEVAERLGATTLRLQRGAGPYAARNAGWRSTDSEIVVFTDVRNRAQAGWIDGLVAPFDDAEIAIVGGRVVMTEAETAAQRLAVRIDLLDAGRRTSSDWLPYVPTASMAVRRTVLEALDGFREVRSGGDVDLCWRAQVEGLGRVVATDASAMHCRPRASARELVRQWTRYGYGNVEMRARFAEHGCPVGSPPTIGRWIVDTIRTLGAVALRRRTDVPVEILDRIRLLAYLRAARRAHRSVGP